jgi:hypothetical protein
MIQAHIHDLHRARRTRGAQPIATMSRPGVRKRRRLQLSIYLWRPAIAA